MTSYAKFDGDGKIIQFYDSDVYKNIPNTAIQISTDDKNKILSNPAAWRYSNGSIIEINIPQVAIVPEVITLWQARAALADNNLLVAANSAIYSSNNKSLITIWEYGNEIHRSSNTLNTIATTLNLTPQNVDDLFIYASSLTL